MVEPPLRGAAQWPGPWALFVVNIEQNQLLAARHSGVEGGIVPEAQVVTKPDDARAWGHQVSVEGEAGWCP